MTRVSCVLTSHNRLDMLLNMHSILSSQTLKPHEILPICSGYDAIDTPFKIYGVPDCNDWGHDKRARGLAKAKGSWVLFANDDDIYAPYFLEKMTEAGKRDNADIVYCNFSSHLYNGEVVNSSPEHGRITSGNFIVKRKFAQKVGWNHRHYQADWEFIRECKEAGAKFTKVDECLYIHR